jgi:hypothetical protein
MVPTRPLLKLRESVLSVRRGGIAAVILLTAFSVMGGQNPPPIHPDEVAPPAPAVSNSSSLIAPKPLATPPKSNREKTQADAAQLSALADQLRDQLNKMSVHVLSLDVIQKTQAIENLAKKIKAEADEH